MNLCSCQLINFEAHKGEIQMSKNNEIDENENVVIGFFANKEAADDAIDGLKQWDKANDHIKFGAIGTITKDGDKVKTHVGRKTGKGALIGAGVGVIAAVLTGGASIIGTTVLGGALGAFFKKSSHLTKDEIAQIGTELDSGKVAVLVPCDDWEIDSAEEFLKASHGTVRTYKVPTEALEAAAPAVSDDVASDDSETDDAS
jgi:hypothetical protein